MVAAFDKAATATVILQKLANIISAQATDQISDDEAKEIRNILLGNRHYQMYLLQQIQPPTSIFKLLKSNMLAKLGLSNWVVCDGILL